FASRPYAPPIGPVEETLATLWQDLLGIDRISRHDDFFSLGGHSLLAVQLISRLRASLGMDISLAEFFSRPMLADVAHGLEHAAATETGPIPLADRNQPLPLSFAQQRLWFLDHLEGASAHYNMPLALRLRGALHTAALQAALDQLVVRHAARRTCFIASDGEPRQHILPANETSFDLHEHDLSSCPDVEQALAAAVEQEASEPFDLAHGPLVRGRLLRLTDQEHALLLTFHHGISDGWSLGVLGRELSALYDAFRQGGPDPLPPLPIQYADYAVWERQWVAGARLQRQAAYWKDTLTEAPGLLELPTDRPRPPVQDFVGAVVPITLDGDLTAKLKAVAKRHGATLFQVLLASFGLLLSRLSGQEEVVIGSPSAHRSRSELEGLIGCFVNTLALRIDTNNASVSELINRAKAQTLNAQAHEDLPFEHVVELLQPPRSLAHAPLFQVMFAWQNIPQTDFVFAGLTTEDLMPTPGAAKFDLTLYLNDSNGGIEGGLDYATALFDQTTIERWVGHWRTLLTALVEASDATPAASLPLLNVAERQLLLHGWNATQANYPEDQCLHQLFEAQVERSPDAIALVFERQSLSYKELNARANFFANQLISLGISPDDRVAIGVERSLEMVVGLLAILKAGGAYVPLDPSYPEERLAFMVEDSAPVALLVHGATRQRLAPLKEAIPMINLDGETSAMGMLSVDNPDPKALGLSSNNLAYVIYTSGSTGTPKGVMVEHRNAVNFIAWSRQEFPERILRRTLFSTSINFDLSIFECFATLSGGGASIIVRNVIASGPALADVTLINTVPSAMQTLLRNGSLPANVQAVNLAGEPLREDLVKLIFQKTQIEQVRNLYGPSETTTYSTWVAIRRDEEFTSHIGRPLSNTLIYLLDGKGHPVPIGVVGEIHIGGAGVARGYLNRPELTAERFLPDPFSKEPDARMYRTGDLAR
ncbi:MAG: amino acid adenylation domain-containing protein, partial [Cyanobacteriota bacterium]